MLQASFTQFHSQINTPALQWSPGVCGFPFQSWGPCAQTQLREPLSDVSFRKSVMTPTSVTHLTLLHHAGIVSLNPTTVRDPERARTHSHNLLRLSGRCTASFREGPHPRNLPRQSRRDFLIFTSEFCGIGKYAKWRQLSLVDDNSKSERIEVGCGSGGSPERMGIFHKPTVMPGTQCLRPMAMAKPRPGQTQGKPFTQSLSPTKSECLQMMNQCAKPSSSSFLLWTACSLRLLLCRDLLLTPAKPAFLSICAPDTHLLHSHVQKKWAEFPGCRDISPQWPQSTPSELSYTCVCVSILSSFPVTPVNSVPE